MKRGLILLISMLFIIAYTKEISAIGLSPYSLKIPYAAGESVNVSISLINNAKELRNATLQVGGEDAQWVEYPKEYYFLDAGTSKEIILTINFPQDAEPGMHRISLTAKEMPSSIKGTGISVFGEVSGTIDIMVPYPGTYAQISVSGKNTNVDEPMQLEVNVNNLGKRTIEHMIISVVTYDKNQMELERISEPLESIQPGESRNLKIPLKSQLYHAGDYIAVVSGRYGVLIINEEIFEFRVGHLFVNVSNVVFLQQSGGLYRVSFDARSEWNAAIENVYATVEIFDENEQQINILKTPSINLGPWEKSTISTFFDATNLIEEVYNAKITLFYNEKTTIIDVPFSKMKPTQDFSGSAFVFVIILVLIFIIDYLWMKNKKGNKPPKDINYRL
mgnify:CR=1 FL=1